MKLLLRRVGLALGAGVLALTTSACQMRQGGTFDQPARMSWIYSEGSGCFVGAGTVGTSADAGFSYAEKLCPHPRTGKMTVVKSDGTFGPTVAGQVAIAMLQGVGAAAMQGFWGYAIAGNRSPGCEGSCAPTFNVNNASGSQSAANAQQQQSDQTRVRAGGGQGGAGGNARAASGSQAVAQQGQTQGQQYSGF